MNLMPDIEEIEEKLKRKIGQIFIKLSRYIFRSIFYYKRITKITLISNSPSF